MTFHSFLSLTLSWRSSRIPWLFLNVIPLGRLCLGLQEQTESSLDEIDMFGEEGCKRSDVHDDVSQYLWYWDVLGTGSIY